MVLLKKYLKQKLQCRFTNEGALEENKLSIRLNLVMIFALGASTAACHARNNLFTNNPVESMQNRKAVLCKNNRNRNNVVCLINAFTSTRFCIRSNRKSPERIPTTNKQRSTQSSSNFRGWTKFFHVLRSVSLACSTAICTQRDYLSKRSHRNLHGSVFPHKIYVTDTEKPIFPILTLFSSKALSSSTISLNSLHDSWHPLRPNRECGRHVETFFYFRRH